MTGSGGTRVGRMGAVFGFLAVVGICWIWALTGSALNPPDWVRFLGALLLPIGIAGAVAAGITSFLRHADRGWAMAGLGMAALAMVILVGLQFAYG